VASDNSAVSTIEQFNDYKNKGMLNADADAERNVKC